MTPDDIRAIFVGELTRIAPDLDPGEIGGGDHLQEDLDLDSMDILNLVSALQEKFSIEIREPDYRRLETPDRAVAYLAGRIG
ncbi:MAG: acyl carrier protein [Pseudooceanicola sp.]